MEKIKLSDFIDTLKYYLERHKEWEEDDVVVVRTQNPSVGPCAVVGVMKGFDWDVGRLFLTTEKPLCYAIKVTLEMAEEAGKTILKSWRAVTEFPRTRKNCWMEGFIEGVKWGSTKLLENNVAQVGQPGTLRQQSKDIDK